MWGADLVDMQEWSKENKGFKYMLTVIDVFSKYAWSIPLKDKRGDTVTAAFRSIPKRKPKHLWVDKGKEFYNKNMDAWLKENNIIRYSTYGENKSAVIERFNRTLKEKMWRRFTAENTRNWINMIDNLIDNYNNTKHSTIKMTPVEASNPENSPYIITGRKYVDVKPKKMFKVGDRVRISRIKGVFEKGYLPNWTEELFVVDKIQYTKPITYKLKDLQSQEVDGSFYEEELQKSSQDIYRIEKVIRKKKINGIDHALVKYMGYSDKFNEWVPVENLKN